MIARDGKHSAHKVAGHPEAQLLAKRFRFLSTDENPPPLARSLSWSNGNGWPPENASRPIRISPPGGGCPSNCGPTGHGAGDLAVATDVARALVEPVTEPVGVFGPDDDRRVVAITAQVLLQLFPPEFLVTGAVPLALLQVHCRAQKEEPLAIRPVGPELAIVPAARRTVTGGQQAAGMRALRTPSPKRNSTRSAIRSQRTNRSGLASPGGKCSTAAAAASTAFYSRLKAMPSSCITSATAPVAPSTFDTPRRSPTTNRPKPVTGNTSSSA